MKKVVFVLVLLSSIFNEAYSQILASVKIENKEGLDINDARVLCLMLKDFAGMIENEKLRKLDEENRKAEELRNQ
jgi:hypothetical protein